MLGIVDGQTGGVDRERTIVVNGVEVGDRAGLAEAIALDDLDAGEMREAARQLGRHRCGPHHDHAHAAPVDATDVRLRREDPEHGRHREDDRDALRGDESATRDRVEALHDHHAGTGVDGGSQQHEPIDVIEGQEDEEAVLVGGADRCHELDVVAHEGLVAEPHALG